MKVSKRTTVVALAAALLLAASCSNSTSTGASSPGAGTSAGSTPPTRDASELQKNVPSDQPGVTDTEIKVASIASITNPLGVDYSQAAKGTQAYFDMVNAGGGIYGRKLVLSEQIDDQLTKNAEAVKRVVSEDEVFAVLPVTVSVFTGVDDLAASGIPTFGWTANDEWSGNPTMFGEKGSYLCIACGSPTLPFVTREIGAKNLGVVAYGQAQSLSCVEGVRRSFSDHGETAPLAFVDDTLPFGTTDYSVPVQKAKDANVDLLVSCLDVNGTINLARETKKQGLTAPLYIRNGYEVPNVQANADVLEGAYLGHFFAPIEFEPASAGMTDFKEWIAKVPDAAPGEQTLVGWLNADLFYRALVAAGPEFTRASVVAAANQITDWTGDGILHGFDWTKAHDQAPDPWCTAFVQVKSGKFVPAFTEPGKPFVCFPLNGPVPAQPPRA